MHQSASADRRQKGPKTRGFPRARIKSGFASKVTQKARGRGGGSCGAFGVGTSIPLSAPPVRTLMLRHTVLNETHLGRPSHAGTTWCGVHPLGRKTVQPPSARCRLLKPHQLRILRLQSDCHESLRVRSATKVFLAVNGSDTTGNEYVRTRAGRTESEYSQ